jgi:hypothetical protein
MRPPELSWRLAYGWQKWRDDGAGVNVTFQLAASGRQRRKIYSSVS